MTAKPVIEPSPKFVSQEAFERWCADPVTRFVAASYAQVRDQQQEEWLRASWNKEIADPLLLRELRTREDCYAGFLDTDYLAHASHLIEHLAWRKFFEKRAEADREARRGKKA